MDTKLNYRPSDLGYYTTWWLTPTSSNASQVTTLATQISSKSDEQCVIVKPVILYKDNLYLLRRLFILDY